MQDAVTETTAELSEPQTVIQPAIYDETLAEMCSRIGLTRGPAIQTSGELWPDRTEASRDISGYLQWHTEVGPGGIAHPINRDGLAAPPLVIKARSIDGLSLALIGRLDHFHRSRMGLEETEGAQSKTFKSLQAFFQPLQCYTV